MQQDAHYDRPRHDRLNRVVARHLLADHDWNTAQQNAPWRTYVNRDFEGETPYQRARIDWWPLAWPDAPLRSAAFLLLAAFALALGWAGWRWARLLHD